MEAPAAQFIQILHRQEGPAAHMYVQAVQHEGGAAGFPQLLSKFFLRHRLVEGRLGGGSLHTDRGRSLPIPPHQGEGQAGGLPLCQPGLRLNLLLLLRVHILPVQAVKQGLISLPEGRFFPERHHVPPIVLPVISVGKSSPVKEIQEETPVRGVHRVALSPPLQVTVHVFPVDSHHPGGIAGTLHAALDLHGIYARLHHVGDQIQGAQILQAEHISLVLLI